MPVAERPTAVIRGLKTIGIPRVQPASEQVIDDPERFRNFLDRHIDATPPHCSPRRSAGATA